MGEVMHCVVQVMNFVWGFSNLYDAEDASKLCSGLHHFALVTKKAEADAYLLAVTSYFYIFPAPQCKVS